MKPELTEERARRLRFLKELVCRPTGFSYDLAFEYGVVDPDEPDDIDEHDARDLSWLLAGHRYAVFDVVYPSHDPDDGPASVEAYGFDDLDAVAESLSRFLDPLYHDDPAARYESHVFDTDAGEQLNFDVEIVVKINWKD